MCLMGLSGGMHCGSVNMSWYSSHSLFQRVVVFVSCLCSVSYCVVSVYVVFESAQAVVLASPGAAADAVVTAG